MWRGTHLEWPVQAVRWLDLLRGDSERPQGIRRQRMRGMGARRGGVVLRRPQVRSVLRDRHADRPLLHGAPRALLGPTATAAIPPTASTLCHTTLCFPSPTRRARGRRPTSRGGTCGTPLSLTTTAYCCDTSSQRSPSSPASQYCASPRGPLPAAAGWRHRSPSPMASPTARGPASTLRRRPALPGKVPSSRSCSCFCCLQPSTRLAGSVSSGGQQRHTQPSSAAEQEPPGTPGLLPGGAPNPAPAAPMQLPCGTLVWFASQCCCWC